MTDRIQTGSVLMEDGTPLPASITIPREPYSEHWSTLNPFDRKALERSVRDAGWSYFYMAGELQAGAFGTDRGKTLHAALNRAIAAVAAQGCNSLEVSRLSVGLFLGCVHVSVSVHARHLQPGCVFRAADPREGKAL